MKTYPRKIPPAGNFAPDRFKVYDRESFLDLRTLGFSWRFVGSFLDCCFCCWFWFYTVCQGSQCSSGAENEGPEFSVWESDFVIWYLAVGFFYISLLFMVESLYLNWTSSILFILGDWGQLVVKSVNRDSSIHCCSWYGPVSECIRNLRCSSTQDASHNQDGISFLIGDHLKYSQTKEELDMSGDGQTYGRGFLCARVFFCYSIRTSVKGRWKLFLQSWHLPRNSFFKSTVSLDTPPKTNMDTQNDGLEKEKVAPLKYGNFWYLC